MADPFIGEIRLYPYTFLPLNWHWCDGHVLSIQEYPALASILGTTYGGDGKTTFGLPDLRDRAVCGAGQGAGLTPHALGQKFGATTASLASGQMPAHTHVLQAGNAATGNVAQPGPTVVLTRGNVLSGGKAYATKLYSTTNDNTTKLAANAITPTGAGATHTNVQPNLVLQYCIALDGIYPEFQ